MVMGVLRTSAAAGSLGASVTRHRACVCGRWCAGGDGQVWVVAGAAARSTARAGRVRRATRRTSTMPSAEKTASVMGAFDRPVARSSAEGGARDRVVGGDRGVDAG